MTPDEEALFRQRVRIMQIFAAAVMGGLGLTFVVMVVIRVANPGNQGKEPDLQILSLLSLIFLWIAIFGAWLFPGFLVRSNLQRIAAGTWRPPEGVDPLRYATDWAKLLLLRQTTLIITLALFEGAGFQSLIAFFIEGPMWVLSVTGVVVAIMLLNFPRLAAVYAWIQRHQEQLDTLRQFGEPRP